MAVAVGGGDQETQLPCGPLSVRSVAWRARTFTCHAREGVKPGI
ncbi:MAG: hypothetical protein OXF63_13540 [Anaerolineaceae bacterium]|nr:hypothetical protein [Anaerolineaceae bacterium]